MAQSCLDKVPVLFATMKPVSIRFHLRQWGPLLAHYWICLIAIIGPIKKSFANYRCTLLAQSRHCNVILACIDSPITRTPVKSKRNINGPLCPCLLGSCLFKKHARHQCDVCMHLSDCLVVYNQFVTLKKCMAATSLKVASGKYKQLKIRIELV